jgi:hypothetical protein
VIFLYRALLVQRPSRVQSDLNEDDVVGTIDSEVGGIVNQSVSLVLGDYLKAVLRRYVDGFCHCAMNSVRDLAAILGRLSLA